MPCVTANYSGCNGDTSAVGAYSPAGDSPLGLVDMAGNVWNWTNSLNYWNTSYIIKGGCYSNDSRALAVSFNDIAYHPNTLDPETGFRCVLGIQCPQGQHLNDLDECVADDADCVDSYYDNGLGECVSEGCAKGYGFNSAHKCVSISEIYISIPAGEFTLTHESAEHASGDTVWFWALNRRHFIETD